MLIRKNDEDIEDLDEINTLSSNVLHSYSLLPLM